MLVVKLELWPGGDESKAENYGIAYIVNDGKGTATVGSYAVTLMTKGGACVYKSGQVLGFKRKKFLAWDLLLVALAACVHPDRFVELLRLTNSPVLEAINGLAPRVSTADRQAPEEIPRWGGRAYRPKYPR